MMPLRIPEQAIKAIEILVSLDASQRDALIVSLRNTSPSTSMPGFVRSIPPIEGIERVALQEVVINLVAIYGLLEELGYSAQDAAADLLAAVEAQGIGDEPYSPERKDELARFFQQIFSLEDSLGLTSKAGEVSVENANNFGSARVLTDVRPIFLHGENPTPKGAVIVHMLKIQIHESDQEYFFALDSQDLLTLQEVLARAVQKERALKAVVDQAGLTWIGR